MENKIELIDYLFSMEKKKIAYSKINIDYKFNIDTLKLIEKAILNSKKIKTTYHDKLRTIEPLGVIFKEKAYVIGYEKEKGEDIYCYDLSKFKDLKLTDFDFDKNNFNLKEYAEKSFGIYGGEIYNIELLFNQSVENKIIDKVFHPSQKIVKNSDGTTSMYLKASGKIELFRFIFKFGNSCKIVSPKNLKEEFKKYLTDILSAY